MKVALCTSCASGPEETTRKVIELARHGCWICPKGFRKCGSVDGVTQDEMREEVFKRAVLEMVSPSGGIQ